MSFDYLIDKIATAPMGRAPFAHIEIVDFFSAEHFAQIIATPEIMLQAAANDEALFDTLFKAGWKIIGFPGCITDHKTYIRWHKQKKQQRDHNNSACEGFGITLRLMHYASPILSELSEFLASTPFKQAIAQRFSIALDAVIYDGGIQKYLDGYEISPHPDIRRKALTFMVNVNPDPEAAARQHHTHYLTFNDAYRYVQTYWDGHPHADRCWVPWDWCDTQKIQRANNSIVIFAPGNDTMHGVKAQYDHLHYQRTQLYGNLWYHENPSLPLADWEDLVIYPGQHRSNVQPSVSLVAGLRAAIPASVKQPIRRLLGRDASVVATRNNTP